MPRTITCHHCGKVAPRNPRIKKQKYCSLRVCQNARRYTTNKERSIKVSESRLLRKARNKRWRDMHLSHAYQKHYRDAHPVYVKCNVELQRERNKKRQKEHIPMIVKTYALSPQPLRDGVYTGFEVKNGKIVKTYALMSQMRGFTDNISLIPPNLE
jgi:hypothetical protein